MPTLPAHIHPAPTTEAQACPVPLTNLAASGCAHTTIRHWTQLERPCASVCLKFSAKTTSAAGACNNGYRPCKGSNAWARELCRQTRPKEGLQEAQAGLEHAE
jgi:hypothetical protein